MIINQVCDPTTCRRRGNWWIILRIERCWVYLLSLSLSFCCFVDIIFYLICCLFILFIYFYTRHLIFVSRLEPVWLINISFWHPWLKEYDLTFKATWTKPKIRYIFFPNYGNKIIIDKVVIFLKPCTTLGFRKDNLNLW